MWRAIARLKRDERGFTLIELMVVVAIIAILVAIAIPAYLNATTNAKRKTCQANLRTIDGAINTYAAENGANPPDGTLDASHALASYVKSPPEEPFSGDNYTISGGVAVCPAVDADDPGFAPHTY